MKMMNIAEGQQAGFNSGRSGARKGLPMVEEAHWGYTIRHPQEGKAAIALASVGGHFLGSALLLVAAGLWILPDSLMGADILGLKLAAMVMFTLFGGYFIWIGREGYHPEFHVDRVQREIRIGYRALRGEFVLTGRQGFSDIGSVYLLRSKTPGEYTRLFLRLGDSDMALEVARGLEAGPLEGLRDRLSDDLSHDQRLQAIEAARVHSRLAA